ncbi:hypothetical protein TNCV_1194761 [Trichonephila clavipes]|nr:hypothetical protein TNCV_1194761 [Trichonephila clavipes]
MGRTILLERRQSESVGRRSSRTTFLRSDWPRPFRSQRNVEMECPVLKNISNSALFLLIPDEEVRPRFRDRELRKFHTTCHLRSDWPRSFARREVGVEMDWVDPKINDPETRRS